MYVIRLKNHMPMSMLLLVAVIPLSVAAQVNLAVTSASPTIAVQTEPVQFQVLLQNNGSAVTLNTQTSIEFTDEVGSYRSLLMSETTIETGASATLLFAMEAIPSEFTPGSYIPALTCRGLVEAESFTDVLTLSQNPLAIKPNMTHLSEQPAMNWPRHPSNGCFYPYLVWLSNTDANAAVLDANSHIAITDGNNLYACASLAVEANLPLGEVTKIEFEEVDFGDAPVGQYHAVITLIGPSYSQTLILSENPIEVVGPPGNSLGGGPSTAEHILATGEQVITEFTISASLPHDQLIHFEVSPRDVNYPDAPAQGEYSAPVFSDIDSDGDLDFFAGGSWGAVAFVENLGTAAEASWGAEVVGYESIRVADRSKPAFVDIDADGDEDLFVGDADGMLSFYRNLGTAEEPDWYSTPRPYPDPNIPSEMAPAFVDIDADSDFDLFAGCGDGTVWYYQNIGAPNLPNWTDGILCAETDACDYSVPAFADIDNDADFDLFIGSGNGTIAFVENAGTPSAPSWATIMTDYAAIDAGNNAAPAFADIDADGDLDLFIGRQSCEGVVFYRNTGTSFVPAWTEEPFSPTYINPAQAPEILTWDPPSTALITDPNVSFRGPSHNRLLYFVTFAATGQELMGVKYDLPIYAKTVQKRSGTGIILYAGVKLPCWITCDDNTEAIISHLSTDTTEIARYQNLYVDVKITNPKPYWLPLDLSSDVSTLTFWAGQQDVSEQFDVSLISGPDRMTPHGQAALTFSVTPLGDATLGQILVDPMVTTHLPFCSAPNWGSTEWPIPNVLHLNVFPINSLITDTNSVTVPECSAAALRVKLSDRPLDDVVVSAVKISGDPDIYIESASTLTFTPENWHTYQSVILAAAEDQDNDNGGAVIRISAPDRPDKEIEVVELDLPCNLYVNDEIADDGFEPGDDDNDGLSPQTPMRHIQALLDKYPDVGLSTVVHISAGTYVENIVIDSTHSGLVLSGAGTDSTVLDGNQSGSCLQLNGFASGTITGLTIRNGSIGGGINCYSGSNPTVTDCTIIENSSSQYGGGIACERSSPVVKDCNIVGNFAFYGGGISCYYDSSPTIQDCTITENSVSGGAGGILVNRNSSPSITNCTIANNRGESQGGGISLGCDWDSNPEVINCTITGNTAEYGAGIHCIGNSRAVIESCLITANSAEYGGGGIRCEISNPIISNCTICGNSVIRNDYAGGGGLFSMRESSPKIKNCIFIANRAEKGSHIAVIYFSHLTVSYSNVQGGQMAVYTEQDGTFGWDPANIDADPSFVKPGFWDDNGTEGDTTDDFWVDGDYHLQWDSPCINTADPCSEDYLEREDIDDEPRLMIGRLDMGADEVGERQADFTRNGIINPEDVVIFAEAWMSIPGNETWYVLCDLYEDEQIDLTDFAEFAKDWLWRAAWYND